jgi:hypothetical protein
MAKFRDARIRRQSEEAEAKRLELEAQRVANVRKRFVGVVDQIRGGRWFNPTPEALAALDELRQMLPDLDEVQRVTAQTYLDLAKE